MRARTKAALVATSVLALGGAALALELEASERSPAESAADEAALANERAGAHATWGARRGDPPPEPTPTPESLDRKARSEARLAAEGVPVSRDLPVIESAAGARIRGRDAVVDRAIALTIVAMKGEGLEQEQVLVARTRFGAAAMFSPAEQAFIADPAPSRRDRARFSWQYECLGVLLWALGIDDTLAAPTAIVDAAHVVRPVLEPGAEAFRARARLRSAGELLDAADLIYRYDWACTEARVNGAPSPAGVDCEVVVERHRALNWLIGYLGQDWDDVRTDT